VAYPNIISVRLLWKDHIFGFDDISCVWHNVFSNLSAISTPHLLLRLYLCRTHIRGIRAKKEQKDRLSNWLKCLIEENESGEGHQHAEIIIIVVTAAVKVVIKLPVSGGDGFLHAFIVSDEISDLGPVLEICV
jgi:hypothetical protein